jgi:hypothetical protein
MKTAVARVGLTLMLALGGCATQKAVNPSPYFPDVAKHLDMGGEVFVYADVDGDLPVLADQLDQLIKRVGKGSPELHLERINARRILGQLGLDDLLALGLSSTKDGKVFHNKAFLQQRGPRRGLLLLTGAEPRDLEGIRQAPGDADLVFETDLKLKSLFDLGESILKDVRGRDTKDLLDGLDEKIPGTSLTLRRTIEQLDTRLVCVLRVAVPEGLSLATDGNGFAKPVALDLLIAIDHMAVLFDAIEGLLRPLPSKTPIKFSQDGDLRLMEMDVPVRGVTGLRPVLAKDAKTGRVFLATSTAFVKEFLSDKAAAGRRLGDAPEFKTATSGFLKRANGLSYLSGAFFPKLARVLAAFGKADPTEQPGIDIFVSLLPEGGIPFASQQVNLPDGLYYASNSPYSHKTMLLPSLLVVPVAIGAALFPALQASSNARRTTVLSEYDARTMVSEIEACSQAIVTLTQQKHGADKAGRPKARALTPSEALPKTLPVVCPNPRTSSTDPTVASYRALGWDIRDFHRGCYQYKREDRKGAPAAFSCHAWTDRDDVAPSHWSAQGTWDAEQGTWQITDPRKTAD